jgi:hypothetical protein
MFHPLGDQVMLFVSKVDKKNIRIRFFEEDDAGNIIWEDFGEFSENNVHHQYGISFKTPAYRNPNISLDVEVSILYTRTIFLLKLRVILSGFLSINQAKR